MNKIKEILSFLAVIFSITLLGFVPIGQKEQFSFDLKNLGVKMVEAGVIREGKFENLSTLNLLWAFGLSNKNPVLEDGPMMDPKYGGAENFASTGGWTLSKGSAMDHYSMHEFVVLSEREQALVERVAKNIYRPCCKNSTYFPDCNHGMAMLGLLELMASQGASENEMYRIAEEVNGYWFPEAGSNCNV